MSGGRPRANLTGQVFGRLTAIRPMGVTLAGDARWECRCECGGRVVVLLINLRNRSTQSCGCLNRDCRTTHGAARRGGSRSRTYWSWAGMWARCTNPRHKSWQNYGGRGIVVTERWRDFAVFVADMGPKPSSGHSIDRINNDGNYEPTNCRWATRKEQAANSRRHKCHSSQMK